VKYLKNKIQIQQRKRIRPTTIITEKARKRKKKQMSLGCPSSIIEKKKKNKAIASPLVEKHKTSKHNVKIQQTSYAPTARSPDQGKT
jgi:hypothetical protein